MSLKDKALQAVRRGFYVFPLSPNSKVPPKGVDWRQLATNDPFIVEALWADAPDANVGLVPGRSGHVVLDVDTKNGKDGEKTLAERDPDLSVALVMGGHKGLVVRTPSGGLHIYFTTDTPVGNTAGTLGVGLDTRSTNGYVLAPGSIVDGVEYSVMCDGPIPTAPGWITARKIEEKREASDTQEDSPTAIAWAINYVKTLPALVEGEGSDNGTMVILYKMRDHGVSQEAAVALLTPWAERCGFDIPWLELKAGNAYRYAQNGAGCDDPAAMFKKFMREGGAPAEPEAPKPNRFDAAELSGEQIDSMPSPVWVFKKLIEERSLNLMRGAYGTKKTFLALDIALRAALGKPWAGHESTGARRVMYCAGEGSFGLRGRLKAWVRKNEVGTIPANFILQPTVPIASDAEDWNAFLDYVDRKRPEMIFIDTVARSMIGLDEMSTRDMMVFVARCGQLQAMGAAVFLVHHEGKDQAKGSRGSSALPAAVELELNVSIDKSGDLLVRTAKVKNAPEWATPQVFMAEEVVFDKHDAENGSSLVVILGSAPRAVTADPIVITENGAMVRPPQKDFALATEIRGILVDAARKSPTNKVRNHSELAVLILAGRAERGEDGALMPTDPDYGREAEALRKALSRKCKVDICEPYYDEMRGGWGYWGPLDEGAG